MKKLLVRFRDTFFAPHLDFRIRLFHVLAMLGMAISLYAAVAAIPDGLLNVVICLSGAGLSVALILFANFTAFSKRFLISCYITVVAIFLGLFPLLFFAGGGYSGSMPFIFLLAVVFTVIMLEGGKALIAAAVELAVYIGLFVFAYTHPESVAQFATEKEVLFDVSLGLLSVGATLALTVWLQFRLYNRQQKTIDEQNAVLAQTSRAKTEFLANTSHEMRTPLTVISVSVQTVIEILEDMGLAEKEPEPSTEDVVIASTMRGSPLEAGKLLQTAQDEIMRLARMVGGMLTLTSMSEGSDKGIVDFTALLSSGAEMLRLNLQTCGNTLATGIETGLRVFGNADLLAQVVTNLLGNAGKHTVNGIITFVAKKTDSVITVTVRDTGAGIPAELLPRVFERGVSGGGGTGFGLYICKAVVESHGGRIWIESEHGSGTTVYFSLPVYEGQF